MPDRPSYYGTGRRKNAVARVILRPGEGSFVVNRRSLDEYFPRETLRMIVMQPLELTDTSRRFDVLVNVQGGGASGQAGAIKHGLSRALLDFSVELRPILKKAGFITRDSRIKERKKYGKKAARASFQFSKR